MGYPQIRAQCATWRWRRRAGSVRGTTHAGKPSGGPGPTCRRCLRVEVDRKNITEKLLVATDIPSRRIERIQPGDAWRPAEIPGVRPPEMILNSKKLRPCRHVHPNLSAGQIESEQYGLGTPDLHPHDGDGPAPPHGFLIHLEGRPPCRPLNKPSAGDHSKDSGIVPTAFAPGGSSQPCLVPFEKIGWTQAVVGNISLMQVQEFRLRTSTKRL